MFSEDPHSDTKANRHSEADDFYEFYIEWERLRGVATSCMTYDRPGSFLTSFLEAFCRADASNAKLLLPVMQELEKKYKLEDRFPSLQKHKTLDQTAGEPWVT